MDIAVSEDRAIAPIKHDHVGVTRRRTHGSSNRDFGKVWAQNTLQLGLGRFRSAVFSGTHLVNKRFPRCMHASSFVRLQRHGECAGCHGQGCDDGDCGGF